MTERAQWLETIRGEVAWRPVSVSLLAISPAATLFLTGCDNRWLTVTALVTMCATIVEERLSLAPLGVLLHGIAIMVGFVGLGAASVSPILFVILCVVLAAGSICLTMKGGALRSLGNFTFIPALYLASEAVEAAATRSLAAHIMHELPLMAAGLIPVILLAASRRPAPDDHPSSPMSKRRVFPRLSHRTDYGERRIVFESCLAVACAVALAASFVEWQKLDHGQWVIWSAASVVTGEAGTEHLKLRDRAIGALVGVPGGIVLGWGLPHTTSIYCISVVAGLLTLMAFRRYLVGFGVRCVCIALALTVSGHSMFVAGERILNVILGRAIGLACVLALRWFSGVCTSRLAICRTII